MPLYSYPNYYGEVSAWSNTEIRIEGNVYIGVKEFNPPEISSTVENVYGQGNTPVGYSIGNQELPEGSMMMLWESYLELLRNIAGDLNADLSEYPLTIISTYSPSNSKLYNNSRMVFEGVLVFSVEPPQNAQGNTENTVSMNIRIPKKPTILVDFKTVNPT